MRQESGQLRVSWECWFFIGGCHGNIRSQSHVCICGPAVCDSSESHLPPSSHPPHPRHTFIRRRRFLDSTFHCHMHPFFNIVNLASSSLLLFFLSFYVVSLFLTVFLSCALQSIKCFSWNVILTIFSCSLYTNLRFHNRTCSETWAEDGCFYNFTERSFTC